MTEILWNVLGLLIAGGLSFLFSGMEAGVFALSRLRIRQFMRQGNPSARVLHRFLEQPEPFLWTILVGNALANFLVVSLTFFWLHRTLDTQWALWPALALAGFFIYAFADLLPKMLFRQYPNRLCLALARPFRFIHLALSPLVRPVAWLSETLLRSTGGHRFTGRLFGNRDELRLLMQESAQALTTEERTMVNRVLELQHRVVGSVGIPLKQVTLAAPDTPIGNVIRLCRETGLNRLPIRDPGQSRILGIVTLRNSLFLESLDPRTPARAFLQPALFLDDTTRLEVALQRLRQTGQRLAIILDREQKEIGIVTLHDILRTVFGEVSW